MADGLLNKASIILTPTGYKAGTLYNVAPIDEPYEDFDFARTSTATRINSSGLISNVATGVPRISYDSNGDNGHILLEPTSTNLIPYSEDFTQTTTESNSVLVTSNQAISPDGTLNADKLIPASGSVQSNGGRYVSFSSTAGTDYSVSIFVKQAEYRYVTFTYGSSNAYGFHFDLQDGVILQNINNAQYTGISREVESLDNGWYRLKVSLTDENTAYNRFISVRPANAIPTATNNNYSTIGDGTSGIYAWGFQLEQLSYATSYIPTLTGSTETRATETANGAGSADLINSTEGVLYAEIAALADDGTFRILGLSDGTTNNRVLLYYTSTSNQIRYIVESSGVRGVDSTYVLSSTLDFHKVAVKYKTNDFALWINGVERANDTSGSAPIGLNQLLFDDGAGSAPFYGKCKSLAVFNEALSDDELNNLTG